MKNQAFTLIELLVVVLIIGILSAVALPQYNKAVEKTRMAEAVIMVKKLAEAQELFKLENGRWATFEEIDALHIGLPANGTVSYNGQERLRLKDFFCTNQGSENEVNCQRLPGNRYYIAIFENNPTRLICYSYEGGATAIQAKLCSQFNSTGSL